MSSAIASGKASRPRLHIIYYLLAGFDLLTVLLSLYLVDRIMVIYSDSVDMNQVWAERLDHYAELSQAAAAVNAPGNDVFTSHDVKKESERLDRESQNFEAKFTAVRGDLARISNEPGSDRLLAACDAIHADMTTMIAQARQIFEALAADQPEPAGQRMTAMDQSYARVNTALGELGRDVRAIQKKKFEQQTALASHFQKFESAIAFLIVLMVTSVAVYGHRLAKQVKETAAELARHRDHLETLVAERTAELEASHQQLRLSERLASIGTLAAGLGHDMNNVLFPVRCRLDSLGSMELAPAMRAELGAVRQAVDYLQQLCDGLRLLALNPNDPGATAGNTDLASWWRDVEPLLRTALPRQVELKSDWPARLPRVSVPPHRLTQAVFNLVINAGEAIAERGTVWVSGSAHDDGRFVRVAVRDDGRGMGPEERRRALDPFFTTKKRGLSTGLGLSLVHGVARAASGLVEIESKPGSGTTVTMVLPAAEETAGTGEAEKAEQFLVSITLRDRRIATFVAALLRAQGVMVKFEESQPASDGQIWITDASEDRLAAARAFLAGGPARRVVVFGAESAAAWRELGALALDSGSGLDQIRTAIDTTVKSLQGVMS